jgi:hypothetical protein
MKAAKGYATSFEALGQALGTSARAVSRWAKLYPGFPEKGQQGYRVADVKRFAKSHKLGPFRGTNGHANGDGAGDGDGDGTVSGARRLLLIEQRHLARIEKDRRNIDLQTALGGVLLLEDACQHAEQIIGTAKACLLECVDKVDRELPREMSPELRERCLSVVARSARAALDTLAGLTGNEDSPMEETTDAK